MNTILRLKNFTHLFAAALLSFLLAGCAGFTGSSEGKISSATTVCCPGNYQRYTSYSVTNENLPGFLKDYVTDEFEKAFQEKGLTSDTNSDVTVSLIYNHVNLDAEQQQIDPLKSHESLQVELHYNAVIAIEIHENQSGELVWAGQIQRMHRVTPGEHMHQEKAAGEFLLAFRRVLESYPALK